MVPKRVLAVLVASTLLALAAVPAGAQGNEARELAREHFQRGIELAHAQHYEQAIEEFRAAYALAPHHTVLYNIGQAYIALGEPLEAAGALERCLEEGRDELTPERVDLINQQLAAQRAQTAELRVSVDRPDVTIELDGALVGRSPLARPLRVAPGTRVLKVTSPDGSTVTHIVTVSAGKDVELSIDLPSAPQPPAVTAASEPRPLPAAQEAPPPVAPAAPPPVDEAPDRRGTRFVGYALTGAGIVTGIVALGHYSWNRGRYNEWRDEDEALAGERIDGDYRERQTVNDDLARSVERAEPVTVGLAVASGAWFVGGATLILATAKRKGQREATAQRPRFTVAPLGVGWPWGIQAGFRGEW